MSDLVGLFDELDEPDIPATLSLVRTTGYSIPGVGHATYVEDAIVDASYVATHPRASFLADDGRGFRLVGDVVTPQMFGAVGDGTTDDYAAFAAALSYFGIDGGRLFVPATSARYRISQTLVLTKGITLEGEVHSRNPAKLGSETILPFGEWYNGANLYFDAGVPGIQLLFHTDETDPDNLSNLSSADRWKYADARWSVIRNLNIISPGFGGNSNAHGLEIRVLCRVQDVKIRGFGGHGVLVSATAGGSHLESVYGNASQTILDNVSCVANGTDGFRIVGRDANVVMVQTCNAVGNGGWGFNDSSLLGNTYCNCHCSSNANGSFRNSGGVAPAVYLGCYSEQGTGQQTDLSAVCAVIGGILASPTFHSPSSPALVLLGPSSSRAPLFHTNYQGSVSVRFKLGELGPDKVAFAFGSSDDSAAMNAFKMKYEGATANWWGLEYANSSALTSIQFPTGAAKARAHAPAFRNGLFLGIGGNGPRLHSGSSTPTLGTWERGDLLFRTAPSASGKIGWVCTTAGTQGTLNSGGTTGSIDNGTTTLTVNTATGLLVGNYITIAGVSGVKKVTAISGTSVTIATAASATVVDAAVGFSPATFKEWGAIDS